MCIKTNRAKHNKIYTRIRCHSQSESQQVEVGLEPGFERISGSEQLLFGGAGRSTEWVAAAGKAPSPLFSESESV